MAGGFSPRTILINAGFELTPVVAEALDAILKQVMVASYVQIAANAAVLVGCIGLLLRRRWGWYLVCILHVAQIVVGFTLGLPLIRATLAVVMPESAMSYGLLITALMSLVPLAVVVFLMLPPVAGQFERPAGRPAASD